ncbi:hypothetical protein F4819DRAFT_485500 [Hypoxylon fuscum]|nr:hypothetical protein F4819DRAFT_485500 [Hypoxylon fuscum]
MTTIFDGQGSNPLNPFSTPIQALLTSSSLSSAPDETPAHLVITVITSSDPVHALWELWDAFFVTVASSVTSHGPLLALLDALYAHPPTRPNNVPAGSDEERQLCGYIQAEGKLHWAVLPRFSEQWRDFVVWQRRQVLSPLSVFSAALLKATRGKGEVHPIWVFYACRDVLEREGLQPREPKAHRMPLEQMWALTATWVRDGSRVLWEANHEELRRHWAAALDDKTELWPREDGLTRERWRLWGRGCGF